MNLEDLVGKTIVKAELDKGPDSSRLEDGYCDVRFTFDDGTTVAVRYSCMGGVYLDD